MSRLRCGHSRKSVLQRGLGSQLLGLAAAALPLTGNAAQELRDRAELSSLSALSMAVFAQRSVFLRQLGDDRLRGKVDVDTIFDNGFAAMTERCDRDRDLDRLADCVETGSGQFVDGNDSGTDPDDADTDGDGLSDGDEVLGTETGLDLAALGASPVHQDLLLEYDWFVSDYDCGTHSQRPSDYSMQQVAGMFAGADVANPDGLPGINVIQDYGQGEGFFGGNRILGYDAILPGAISGTYFDIKRDNFNPARLGYYRYVLLPHRYNGETGTSSGYAEIVGDDAIVALRCFNSESNVTQTIAHEVGHLLGLQHGGFEACNGKPNYNSLMNYRFQLRGVDGNCDANGDIGGIDYSTGGLAGLDENAIDESLGTCGATAIDWNADGRIDPVLALDLNPGEDGNCGAVLTAMLDFDDWDNITFYGLADHTGALKSIQTRTACPAASMNTALEQH